MLWENREAVQASFSHHTVNPILIGIPTDSVQQPIVLPDQVRIYFPNSLTLLLTLLFERISLESS